MTHQNVITRLAGLLQSIESCERMGATHSEWKSKHKNAVRYMLDNYLPHGSGFDGQVTIDESSRPDRIVFGVSFHHMNDVGMYDGWSDHSVIATPSFVHGVELRVTGKNKRDIKDYIAETFHDALTRVVVADSDLTKIYEESQS